VTHLQSVLRSPQLEYRSRVLCELADLWCVSAIGEGMDMVIAVDVDGVFCPYSSRCDPGMRPSDFTYGDRNDSHAVWILVIRRADS